MESNSQKYPVKYRVLSFPSKNGPHTQNTILAHYHHCKPELHVKKWEQHGICLPQSIIFIANPAHRYNANCSRGFSREDATLEGHCLLKTSPLPLSRGGWTRSSQYRTNWSRFTELRRDSSSILVDQWSIDRSRFGIKKTDSTVARLDITRDDQPVRQMLVQLRTELIASRRKRKLKWGIQDRWVFVSPRLVAFHNRFVREFRVKMQYVIGALLSVGLESYLDFVGLIGCLIRWYFILDVEWVLVIFYG